MATISLQSDSGLPFRAGAVAEIKIQIALKSGKSDASAIVYVGTNLKDPTSERFGCKNKPIFQRKIVGD